MVVAYLRKATAQPFSAIRLISLPKPVQRLAAMLPMWSMALDEVHVELERQDRLTPTAFENLLMKLENKPCHQS